MSDTPPPSQRLIKPGTPVVLFGVPFDVVTISQTVAIASQMIASKRPHHLVLAGVESVIRAMRDVEMHRILLEAHLILCDSMPLLLASQRLGSPLPELVSGFDLVPSLLRAAEENGWRVFLLGAQEEVARRALDRLRAQYPKLIVAGHLSPPMAPLEKMDHAGICKAVREAKPDILLVALGCPKQEKWINMYFRALGVPVSIGVGHTIDSLAGAISRAPRWMQRYGLERAYWMMREPHRLFWRYLSDLWFFTWHFIVQWCQFHLNRRRVARYRRLTVVTEKTESGFELVMLPPRFDAAVVRDHEWLWKCLIAAPSHLMFDMKHVQFIDSTGVGLLVRLHKNLVAANCQFVLASLSPVALQSLERLHMPELLTIAADLNAAKTLIAERTGAAGAAVALDLSAAPKPLAWHGEITAVNIDAVKHLSDSYLESCAAELKNAVFDLSDVQFISSAGVGLMGRLKKHGRLRGVEVVFVDPQPKVLRVIKTFRLERYLFGDSKLESL
jgi:N-acetylglucosaminyldiphosphoundecaprenol N-acetyl-beta-D-mannosaminyltransferase